MSNEAKRSNEAKMNTTAERKGVTEEHVSIARAAIIAFTTGAYNMSKEDVLLMQMHGALPLLVKVAVVARGFDRAALQQALDELDKEFNS